MKILLRRVNGDRLAYCQQDDNQLEILPSRNDLYMYDGSFSWGYKGTGCLSLAYAMAALFEGKDINVIDKYAKILLHNLISGLDGNKEYSLDEAILLKVIKGEYIGPQHEQKNYSLSDFIRPPTSSS